MFYCNIKNKFKFYGFPNNMTFPKTEPESDLGMEDSGYRYAQLGAAKLFAVQQGAEQLVASTCESGTTGCGYNWVRLQQVRLQQGAAPTGRGTHGCGKWVRFQPILALKNKCFLQIFFPILLTY
jgi:hypothetical protein